MANGVNIDRNRHAYSRSSLYENNKPEWEKTLYSKLRETYRREGLDGKSTIVIGSAFGDEVEGNFPGTLLDLDHVSCVGAKTRRPLSQVVCADASELPFRDNQFENVVVSLLLSQLQLANRTNEPAEKALADSIRVASSRVIIVETTAMTTTTVQMVSDGLGKPWRQLNDEVYNFELFRPESLGIGTEARQIGSPFMWRRNYPINVTPAYMPENAQGVEYKIELFELAVRK